MYYASTWRMLRRSRSRPAPTGDAYPPGFQPAPFSLSTEIASTIKSPLPTVSHGP